MITTTSRKWVFTALFTLCTFLTSVYAGEKVFKVKDVVMSRDATIRIRDLISNKGDFDDNILDLEVMKAPIKRDRTISLINIAYMLQQYPELLDIHLRGAQKITLKRLKNTEYLNRAKEKLLSYIKSSPPWDSWEVNLMFSPNDERLINRIGAFKRVEIFPFDNKGMIGTVAFRLSFFDEFDREVGKVTVAPVILRKVNVQVLRSRFPQGHIIAASDLKSVPLWIGSEKRGYIIDKKQCIGSELSRTVGAGDILKSNDLLPPICAKRGESIWVKCKVGGLVVRLVAVALETGRKGDVIQVKNRSSKKIINVKLDSSKHAIYSTEG